MTRAEKKAAKLADKRVSAAYHATCSGIQINMMDIPKVFKVGLRAITEGCDDESLRLTVRAYVETIRCD